MTSQADETVTTPMPHRHCYPRARFDLLREGATVSLHRLTNVLRYFEQSDWTTKDDAYDALVEAIAVLASALHKGTEP